MNKNDQAVMFMRIDNSEVSGVFAVDGYVDLEGLKPIEVARLIVELIRSNEQ
jgi:hypothetical protein